MATVSIFLIKVALIVGLAGCTPYPPYPTQSNLTISSTEGGEVTTPGEGTFTYDDETLVNLAAEAQQGYHFVNWTGDVGTIDDINSASTTITMSDEYEITANFEAIPAVKYSLTVSSNTGGSVTTPGEGTFTYNAGDVVNLVASPNSGYQFVNWTGNVDTIGNVNAASTTITMNGNCSVTASFEEQEAVIFLDPHLEAAIREAISKPTDPIYPSDLGRLTSVDASMRNIADLTGLEYCTGLTELELWANQISDVAPLANLTNLTRLWLEWNQISDISSLAKLTNLTVLDLYQNQISDIAPLANLTNLTRLYLTYNQIGDIKPLVQNEGLGAGDQIDLRGNPLSSDSINIYTPQLQARGVSVRY